MKVKGKKGIWKKLEDYFTAITFAEAGEWDFALKTLESEKNILVICPRRTLSEKSIQYIEGLCERIKAGLLFVGRCESQVEVIKETFKNKSIPINYLSITSFSERDLLEIIKNYNIQLIFVESLEVLGKVAALREKEPIYFMEKILEKVQCPLILLEQA
ncbi:MAG: hypothetical protein C0190_05965 [Thermodesulfobacterium geofontis]|uniref:Uncharacterized protein n=1 Tax=Thermodesulfobacterium geofontis TaxID=1295609 RepID=A0A2N7PMC2_9BACT|nr:MAG: hypothetical protein C0190_05965 [Thermodesulfobacterium geofontis]